jgi:hypothetical protein
VLLIGAQLKDFLIGVINGLNVEDDSSGSRDDNSAAPCLTYDLSSRHQDSSYEQQADSRSLYLGDSSCEQQADSRSLHLGDSSYEQQADSRSLHLGDSSGGLRKASSRTSVAMVDNSTVCTENTSSACCQESFVVLQQEEGSSERSRNGRLESNPGRVTWSTNLVHYVKLGEMDAYICCFVKDC